jgi:WD40 repeat protein
MGTVRFRHGEYVHGVLFSRDGKTLISCGADGVIRCWEVPSGRAVRRLEGHRGWVRSLALSPDGKTLASGGGWWDFSLRLWDLDSGKELACLEESQHGEIGFVAFAPDGRTLYAARDYEIAVWEAPGGRRLRTFKPLPEKSYGFSAVTLSPDGRTLAVANLDVDRTRRFAALDAEGCTLRLLDAQTGKEVLRAAWKAKWLSHLAYSPDGRVLAVQDQHAIRLWTSDLDHELVRVPTPESDTNVFAFSPDGRALAVACRNGGGAPFRIRVWDVKSGKERVQLPGHMHFVTDLTFSPDGRYLASASMDASVRLWDLASGREVGPAAGHHGWVWGVAVSPDGKQVATTCSDQDVRLWDAATGRELRRLGGHEREVWAVAFSPDGAVLATGGFDQTVSLWNAGTGKQLHRLRLKGIEVRAVAFSPDSRLLAAGGRGNDPDIHLWDVKTGREVGQLSLGKGGPVYALAFSPDGKHLAAGDNFDIRLWNVARKKQVPWFHPRAGNTVNSLAFSADGRVLLSASDKVQLWEALTGRERLRLPAPRWGAEQRLGAAALSADGRRIASAYSQGRVLPTCDTQGIYFWDALTGERIGERHGHIGLIACAAWSPDGTFLVTGSDDTTALVWATKTLVPRPLQALTLAAGDLPALWDCLTEDDALRAGDAVMKLTRSPGAALPWLEKHLRPVPRHDSKHVAALVAKLDDQRFAERERAAAELRRLGELAEPALRRALKNDSVPLEARRRIDRILEALENRPPPPETLRALRSIEVLERIGSRQARALLQALAAGEPAAAATRQARESLRRLGSSRGG